MSSSFVGPGYATADVKATSYWVRYRTVELEDSRAMIEHMKSSTTHTDIEHANPTTTRIRTSQNTTHKVRRFIIAQEWLPDDFQIDRWVNEGGALAQLRLNARHHWNNTSTDALQKAIAQTNAALIATARWSAPGSGNAKTTTQLLGLTLQLREADKRVDISLGLQTKFPPHVAVYNISIDAFTTCCRFKAPAYSEHSFRKFQQLANDLWCTCATLVSKLCKATALILA
jgi:hypothetical protein